MINLLPPDVKEQVRYSKRNATLIHYIQLSIVITLILAASLFAARYYMDMRVRQTESNIESKLMQIRRFAQLEKDAKALNAKLASIGVIQANQARFSLLLSDLAQYMPKGTSVSSLTLTGDDKKPVRVTVDALDYRAALGFRDTIAKSKRISAADIEGIQAVTDDASARNIYRVTVTFTFNPGEAR